MTGTRSKLLTGLAPAGATWTDEERAAFEPPEDLLPSEWAERYRILPRGQSPRPGPWRNENAPYLIFIMDLAVAVGVIQVNIVKAAQLGVSEGGRNILGRMAHLDPEPAGIALPDRAKGRKIIQNRLIPLFRDTEILRPLVGRKAADLQSEQIRLVNGFLLHLMWSGSASSMASDPMCLDINDEVDKFEEWTGREADAVSLTWKRLRAYEDRAKQFNMSTATTRYGKIWVLFEESDVQLYYHVPCPHCGVYQRLVFPQLKWGHRDVAHHLLRAALVRQSGDVWYECTVCGERIEERHKADMVRAGHWRRLDGPCVDAAGTAHDNAEDVAIWPAGTRIGLQISALYCLWEGWADVAAEFMRAKGNLAATYDFRTQTLGEPWEQQIEQAGASVYAGKCRRAELEEGIVPTWAAKVLATVDTQHDHFWLVLRAWGAGMRSQRVWHGRVETFGELDRLCFHTPWPWSDPNRPPTVPDLVGIDSGGTRLEGEETSRTMQVYQWAWPRKARVRVLKGAARPREAQWLWRGQAVLDAGTTGRRGRVTRARRELALWMLDTHRLADVLADLIMRGVPAEDADQAAAEPDPEQEAWLLNRRADPEYTEHMSNAVKVVVRRGSGLHEEWVPRTSGARMDLWDCEVYQVALAHLARVPTIVSREQVDAWHAAREAARPPGESGSGDEPRKPKPKPKSGWDLERFKI